jgi:S1-C subfamily serine protease
LSKNLDKPLLIGALATMKYPTWLRRISGYLLTFVVGTVFGVVNFPHAPAVADEVMPSPMTVAQQSVPVSPSSFVAAAVAKTGPAVVRIDTETVVTRRIDPILDDPFFRDFLGQSFPVPPREQRIVGQGSGFIIDGDGIILTNAHVVDNASKVVVTLKDGRTFDGEVRGTDEVTDLAVVKIKTQGERLPVAPLGTSGNLQVGDWAIAVGNPVGLDNTVTLGIISTLGRSAAQAGIPDKRVDFIQTDAAINPGNSGGPLLNAQGEVIGINTAIRADANGIGFAIPIDQAKALQKTLIAGEKVPHPYIGVQMMNLTADLARQNNRNPNSPFIVAEVDGILVMRVLPDTPAERAGIRRGDVIVSVDDRPIVDGAKLQGIVEKAGLNRPIKLGIVRGDRPLTLTVQTAQLQSPDR